MRLTPLVFPLLLALSGCVEIGDLRQAPPPEPRPAPAVAIPPERSEESIAQQTYFARVETDLLTRGLLRDDGGGPDVPFTDEVIARNFRALAFSEEFSEIGGRITANATPSTLHRWQDPIRMEIIFGETVPEARQRSDTDLVVNFADRLSRLTGQPISQTATRSNFAVFILHEQDLRRIGPALKKRLPQISRAEIAFVETLPLEAYCLVFTSDPANDGTITEAVAIIRAELPNSLLTSCIHEELSQGLGLANDSDLARPSIFKDDDEFGRLTSHDEILLSILYDDRLSPGMTETEAAPIVLDLARSRMAPAS